VGVGERAVYELYALREAFVFVADENGEPAIVRHLREDGHDLVWIAESDPPPVATPALPDYLRPRGLP
jgi:hypothetical protein